MKAKRQYRKSLRPQKKRGVPVDDERWGELFKFLDERDFTMEDMIACACATLTRYNQGIYDSQVQIKDYFFEVKILKHKVDL